jgi:hypothetical protein
MNQVFYGESFIQKAKERLREMLENDLKEIPYGEPFTSMSIIIGEPVNRTVVAIVDIPDDLKEKLGNKKVYVVT